MKTNRARKIAQLKAEARAAAAGGDFDYAARIWAVIKGWERGIARSYGFEPYRPQRAAAWAAASPAVQRRARGWDDARATVKHFFAAAKRWQGK